MATEKNFDDMTNNEIIGVIDHAIIEMAVYVERSQEEVVGRGVYASGQAIPEDARFYRAENNTLFVMNRSIIVNNEEPLTITVSFPANTNSRKSTQHVMYINGSRYLFGPEDSHYDTGERELLTEYEVKERRLLRIAYEAVRPYIGYSDIQWKANRNIAEAILGITE